MDVVVGCLLTVDDIRGCASPSKLGFPVALDGRVGGSGSLTSSKTQGDKAVQEVHEAVAYGRVSRECVRRFLEMPKGPVA